MPLYDYWCDGCKKSFEIFKKLDQHGRKEYCPECKGEMSQDLSNHTKRDWFREHWNEHLDSKPIFVESKEHYKRLCKERGLTARCLM